MKRENDLGRDNIPGLVVRIAIPSMLAQFVSVFYSIVDRMFVGNIPGTGDLSLAGVGICGPIVTMVGAFAFLVGVGGAPLMGISLGEGRKEQASRIVGNCFLLLCAIALGVQYAIVDGFTGMGQVQLSLPLSFWRKGVYFAAVFALPALLGADMIFYAEPIADLLGPMVSIPVQLIVGKRILQKRETQLR